MEQSAPWLLPHRDGNSVVDVRHAPDWWVSTPGAAVELMRDLAGVEVFELGRSAGGRPIVAGAWGAREALPGRTSRSLAAAIGSGSPAAFFGEGRRQRQSFVYLGAARGQEVEGSITALNMLNVVVTGSDLRSCRAASAARGAAAAAGDHSGFQHRRASTRALVLPHHRRCRGGLQPGRAGRPSAPSSRSAV